MPNCLGGDCHSGATELNTQFDLSSWELMMRGSKFLNEVIPFNAVKSHLFGHINTNTNTAPIIKPTMPYARFPLSDRDQKTFFDWIESGAKSEDGKTPYEDVAKPIVIIHQAEDMFSIIDAESERVVRITALGDTAIKYRPASIAMMPDKKNFIIAMLGASGTFRKFDLASRTITGEFVSHLLPNEIAVTPDGRKGYIMDNSSLKSNTVGAFDPGAMMMIKTINSPVIEQPFAVTISADGKYAYVAGYSSDNILRIDTRTDSIVANLPLGADVEIPVSTDYIRQYLPAKIVLAEDSMKMYVSCAGTAEVVVFDLRGDSIISRIQLLSSPRAAALSPNGKELWVATRLNSIHVISTKTNTIIAQIDSVGESPSDMLFTADGKDVYVACQYLEPRHSHHAGGGPVASSSYVVISAQTKKIISTFEVPGVSVGITRAYDK
ncbi:MAG: hypothetical protein ABI778_04045 [Ignavibacteriota bacterium]